MSLKDWAMANRNHGISLSRISLAATVQLLVVFGGLPAIAMRAYCYGEAVGHR